MSSKKESKGVEFVVDIKEKIEVNVNRGEIQTILVNLFDNALYWINYSKNKDKKILIHHEFDNDKVKVFISDTGIGIKKDEADKIFQPGITAKPHGIGMGLVIVTELLNNYDCKVCTVIPGEFEGATFVFELPFRKG